MVVEPSQIVEAQHERAESAAIGTQWERLRGILVRAEKLTTTSHDRAGLLEDAIELAKRLSQQQGSFEFMTQALVQIAHTAEEIKTGPLGLTAEAPGLENLIERIRKAELMGRENFMSYQGTSSHGRPTKRRTRGTLLATPSRTKRRKSHFGRFPNQVFKAFE